MYVVERSHQIGVAVLRVVVGIVFLWAGLAKVFGPEPFDATGFLQFATGGTLGWPFVAAPVEGEIYNPTNGFWVGLAGSETTMTIINVLVPWGQIGIGIGLILGLLTRFSAAMGTLMMVFFFFAAWEFEHGIVNQHLTYAVVTGFIGYIGAGNFFGADRYLGESASPFVRRWFLSGDLLRFPREEQPVPAPMPA
jgi:thiosulfate dehydrogenase [quinone] large subunit